MCVSFKEIYLENGAYLKYGGYIDFYDEDGEREYYDLRSREPEAYGSEIIACDGEQFVITEKTSEFVILKNCESGNYVWLSTEEYDIGVFE